MKLLVYITLLTILVVILYIYTLVGIIIVVGVGMLIHEWVRYKEEVDVNLPKTLSATEVVERAQEALKNYDK